MTEHEKRMAAYAKAMKELTRPQRQALFVMYTLLPETPCFVYLDCTWGGFDQYRPAKATFKALVRKGLVEMGAFRSDRMGGMIQREGTRATGYGDEEQYRLSRDGIAAARHLFNLVLEGEPLFTDKPKDTRY